MPAQRNALPYCTQYSTGGFVRSGCSAGACGLSDTLPTVIFGQIFWNRQNSSWPISSYVAEGAPCLATREGGVQCCS
jgi:hypothetical protein